MNGRQTDPVVVVRPISHGEPIAELIGEVKSRSWQVGVEPMALKLAGGERFMVKGGRDGIVFLVEGEDVYRTLHMHLGERKMQVARIFGHTHPRVTGPSEGDLEALAILKQPHSYPRGLGGDSNGVRVRPKPPSKPEA